MGRKSKLPHSIEFAPQIETLVNQQKDLPPFTRYIDIPFDRETSLICTRLFLDKPTAEDITNTVNLRNEGKYDYLAVLAARMPYMNKGVKITQCLLEFCISKGFSAEFGENVARLAILKLKDIRCSTSTTADHIRSLKDFLDYLSTHKSDLSAFSILEVRKQDWINYVSYLESKDRWAQDTFNSARSFFIKYPPTSLDGWLELPLAKNQPQLSKEHTSELADEGYSDAVMYQILALCLEGFNRRIGYLKRYEQLSESDMPEDWLDPTKSFKSWRMPDNGDRMGYEVEQTRLIKKWLSDEEVGYQILIDHFILHHKAGLINWNRHGLLYGGIVTSLNSMWLRSDTKALVEKFRKETALSHGFNYPMKTRSIWSHYIKKVDPNESNAIINQIGWCLANLLMMQTGVNKEVVMSIPSKSRSGGSILEQDDPIFKRLDGDSPEIELYGFKERTGSDSRKSIQFSLVKNSPIYEMLLEYERYVKVDFEGPFFEFQKNFIGNWPTAGGIKDFTTMYPIFDEGGNQLKTINTTKFRKVFASAQLLDHINGIKCPHDLAERLRQDLHHGNIDMTLSHYLLNTNVGRSAIDTAIVTITSDKLVEFLHFKGKINTDNASSPHKKVYLCDCEDPFNPSHKISIANECKHYDLCLGCERSVVTKFHLPYICARILQYEEDRLLDPLIWAATFEDLWCIATDTLEQYAVKDVENGKRLVDEAWLKAKSGQVSLPPIIRSNRN